VKKLILLILLFHNLAIAKTPAKFENSLSFIFDKALELKNQKNRPEIPFPNIYFESSTPIKQFQDAIEKQWGQRPRAFTNAYAIESNAIYIMDDADYYKKHQRCIDDSLVHELVHYIQVKYQNWDINDESLEWQAIDLQTNFRNLYCKLN
jgi:hypothetical protein